MRRCFLLIITVVIVIACNRGKVPSGILPPEKMEAVLWDMMRADILVTNYMMTKDPTTVRDTAVTKLYHTIYSLHSISEEKFNKSFLYYKAHPELLKQVMDSISTQPQPVIKTDTDTVAVKKDSLQIRDSLLKQDSIRKKDSLRSKGITDSLKARKDSLLKKRKKRKLELVPL